MIKTIFLSLILLPFSLVAQDKITEVLVAQGFEIPVDIAFDYDDNMYVVEKRGKIALVNAAGIKQSTSFLDILDRVNSAANERGLLGLTFHPDFENNGFFYVNYTGAGGTTHISRFSRINDTLADPDSELKLLSVSQPFNNHNAGALHFGPDGYLYIGLGDGGSSGDPDNRSQNPNLLLGKMLRIDVDGAEPYSIPSNNPYASSLDTLPEIWAFGLRNPWKFSFDQLAGDMYIADVGQNNWEEINVQRTSSKGGENYGWRCYEGFEEFRPNGCGPLSTYTFPVSVYRNNENIDGCSVTGGYVYRGTSIPYLNGRYVYGDYCTGKIWALNQNECGDWDNEVLIQINSQELTTFGQDKYGELYYAKVGEGKVYKVSEKCNLSAVLEITPAVCGLDNGSISIEASAPSFSFEIDGDSLENLSPGEYNLVISDNENCLNNFCVVIESEMDSFSYPIINEVESLVLCGEGESEILEVDIFLTDYPGLEIDLYLDSLLLVSNWDGKYNFTESGIYQLAFRNISNCSSPIQDFIDLSIVEILPVSISRQGDSLIATPGFVAYQWFEDLILIQNNFSNILDSFEVNKTYRVLAYSAEGCASTSLGFIITNLNEVDWIKSLSIGPNPTTGLFNLSIEFDKVTNCEITVTDIQGKLIFNKSHLNSSRYIDNIDLSNETSGLYIIKIASENKTFTSKLVKL